MPQIAEWNQKPSSFENLMEQARPRAKREFYREVIARNHEVQKCTYIAIVGNVGTTKSWAGLSLGFFGTWLLRQIGKKQIPDPYGAPIELDFTNTYFDERHALFDPTEVFRSGSACYVKDLPAGSFVQFDECGANEATSAQTWYNIQNRLLGYFTQTQRYRGINLIFVEPDLRMLSINLFRLLHIYFAMTDKGKARVYLLKKDYVGKIYRKRYPDKWTEITFPLIPKSLAIPYEKKKRVFGDILVENMEKELEAAGEAQSIYSPNYDPKQKFKKKKTNGKGKAMPRNEMRWKGEELVVVDDKGGDPMGFDEIKEEEEKSITA